MSALRNKRQSRNTQLDLECLDLRIAPTTIPTAAVLVAELRVETRQLHKWETSLATAQPGSRHERTLTQRIAGEERLMGRQEVRLARIEARAARLHAPVVVPASNFFNPNAPAMSVDNPGSTSSTTTGAGTSSSNTSSTTTDSGGTTGTSSTGSQTGTTTATGSQSSLPANVSQTLDAIYNAYTASPSDFPAILPTTNGANLVVIQGSDIGIQVHDGNPATFNNLMTELQTDGMQVTTSSAQYGTIVGLLPIAQLPAVASLAQMPSIAPEMYPTLK
jgi:hypothetical protein